MTPIVLVLKTGGDYGPQHVRWLCNQIWRWHPGHPVHLFTDLTEPIDGVTIHPLTHGLPGWWSKLEIMDVARLPGSILYLDLDVVIKGPLVHLLAHRRSAILQGLRRSVGVNSSVMLLAPSVRKLIWSQWRKDPAGHRKRSGKGGDQKFIGLVAGERMDRWQDVCPDTITSAKFGKRNIERASLVVFHGKPRPWNTDYDWVPRLEE